VKTTAASKSIPVETRWAIVSHLAAALAEAWKRQQKDERPERLEHATGRDVHGSGGRERNERITPGT
jgi:hypothetical protein